MKVGVSIIRGNKGRGSRNERKNFQILKELGKVRDMEINARRVLMVM